MTHPETSHNPPAFPRVGEGFGDPRYDCEGMTLRDYFAGQALAGMLANPYWENAHGYVVAKFAGQYADAMLAERAKAVSK